MPSDGLSHVVILIKYNNVIGKGKGRALVIAPHSRHGHLRGNQVHGAHQAASHIPALYLPSRSQYSFTDPERMEGWVNPGPGCKEQLAHGCYATARGQCWGSNPWPRGRWSSTLATRLSRHRYRAFCPHSRGNTTKIVPITAVIIPL